MKRTPVTRAQVESAERVLAAGTWAITAGAVLYSVLTVTPLVQRVTPDGWDLTAPLLPLVVDAAVIVSVRLDSTVARLGEKGGGWATLLRWMTGLMTLGLNVGDSALKRDLVGVGVHSVIPLILIVIADAGLAWRRAIGRALDRIEAEQRAEVERERTEREEREQRARAEREAREQRERDEREREQDRRERADREAREHAERLERERLDREAEERRQDREAEERRERERLESQERREQADRDERERSRQEEREREERREQQAREQREREQRERDQRERRAQEERERANRERTRQRSTPAPEPREQRDPKPVNTAEERPVNKNKLPEERARAVVREGAGTRPVRQLADETGWSVGWVQSRIAELADELVGSAAGGGEQ
ncbi:DUF2637 domain-containing protein [Streptomyces sp. 2MCAF27]